MSDVVFAAVMKVYTGLSGRRATSDIRACHEKRLLDRVIPYNTVFDYLGNPALTPLLQQLIRVSAVPLAGIETRFAVDGTGFGSRVYHRWFDHKCGKQKRESFSVKLHAICGVTTHVFTAVEVTEASLHDSPLLPQLVRETAENFTMNEVSADKGYLASSNLKAIEEVGAKPFIAFKINSRPNGPDVWRRAFHMFAFHREEWLQKYGMRSNVEAVFAGCKGLFGGYVRSRQPLTMANEVLLKVLAYNLTRIVHAIDELGLEPKFWTVKERPL